MTPIASFYCSDRFADLPFPTSEDWEAAIGTILPPSFDYEQRGDGKIELDVKPRDLFTERQFRKFERPWGDKTDTAFFRGTATGGGVTVSDNQRLALASLCAEWKAAAQAKTAATPREQASRIAGLAMPALLDAKLTGWNRRDKKRHDGPMTYIRKEAFDFDAGRHNFVPIFEQSRYKYLIYVEGHCAACRYGFMMRLGSVILKVESRCVADKMWFFPLLRPFVDHVPVRADLSDLADKINWCRANDAECERIAHNALKLFDKFVAKEGLLDYVQLVTTRIAQRFTYPTQAASSYSSSSESAKNAPSKSSWLNDLPRPTRAPKLDAPNDQGCFDEEPCRRCADDVKRDATRRKNALGNSHANKAKHAQGAHRPNGGGAHHANDSRKRPPDGAPRDVDQESALRKRRMKKKPGP